MNSQTPALGGGRSGALWREFSAGRWRPRLGLRHGRTATLVSLLWLAGLVCASFLVPALREADVNAIVDTPALAPSWEHLFGTDGLGRDVFARTLAAARLDLLMALVAVATTAVLGSLFGAWIGSSTSRWVDAVATKIIDAVIAFPFIVFVLVFVVLVGPTRSWGPLPDGAPAVLLGVMAGNWAFYARLARAQAASLRQRDWVDAARGMGYSRWRILRRHILPGVRGPVAAYAVSDLTLVILTIAFLSFVGVGIQAPHAEWGAVMYEGRSYLNTAWWIAVTPGIVLAITGLAFAVLADALDSTRAEPAQPKALPHTQRPAPGSADATPVHVSETAGTGGHND